MSSCCSSGALSKHAINSTRWDFIEFDPTRVVQTLSDGSIRSIRGTLDHDANMVAEGILYVEFRTAYYLMPGNMQTFLPIIGFTNTSGNNWTLTDSLTPATVIIATQGGPEITFTECSCSKWIIRGQRGSDPPRIDIWWMGKTRVENPAGTFFVSATNPPLQESYPYSFTSGVFNYAGNPYAFNQCAFGVDYGLIREWNNSVTATNICPSDHDISLQLGLLYSTCDGTTTLVTTPFTGDVTGGTASIGFSRTVTPTTYQTTFNFANVKIIGQQPAVRNKHDFTRLPLTMRGYSQGSGAALTAVNKNS